MTTRSRLNIIRPIGVAVVSLLLIVGGAFAANSLAGSVASRDAFNAASSAEPSETPEASDGSESTGASGSQQALDLTAGAPEAGDDQGGVGSDDGISSPEPSDDNGVDASGTDDQFDDNGVDASGTDDPFDDNGVDASGTDDPFDDNGGTTTTESTADDSSVNGASDASDDSGGHD
ncbi:MAG: hypothetical protein HYX54_09985 [Chloroflexi bacterium]|nr:hypothetical protein [Chloroflexota bacterium]